MARIGVGLLGCGVVGAAVIRALGRLPGPDVPAIRRVAVRQLSKRRACELASGVLSDDPWAVVEDPTVDVVVEGIGGLEPATALTSRALELGKPVVTANKAMLGATGPRLRRLADHRGVPLLFEAAVAGAVPVIAGMAGLRRADTIVKVEGVLNGTSTFVLSHMERTGATVAEALAEARSLGYAEADATRDLDGSDAADKLALLAQYLFDEPWRTEDVHRLGIQDLQHADIVNAAPRHWRLVATAVRGRCARVEPVRLRAGHPFAGLSGPQCAVTVTGESAGEITMIGTGAGGDATACSVVADILSTQDWVAAGRRRQAASPIASALRAAATGPTTSPMRT